MSALVPAASIMRSKSKISKFDGVVTKILNHRSGQKNENVSFYF